MTRTNQRSPRSLRAAAAGIALTLAATAPVLVPAIATSAAQADPASSLSGSGTAADPYRIGSAADLDTAAAMVNADTGHTGAAVATYELTQNVDYAGGTFATFTWFGGTLDGAGHSIRDITFQAAPTTVGFAETLAGTIKGLTLADATSYNATTTTTLQVGGFAAIATNATITDSALVDSSVTTPDNTDNSSAIGGLVGKATGATTVVSNNYLSGDTVSGDKRLGALVGWETASITVADNYIRTTSLTTHGNSGSGAAFVVGYGNASGTTSITGNVIASGSVHQPGTTGVDAYGWVTSGTGFTVSNNLVNSNNDIDPTAPVGLSSVPDPDPYDLIWTSPILLTSTATWSQGNLGTYTDPADLAQQDTYTAIGWDLTSTWEWDSAASHPVLITAPAVTTSATSITVAQGSTLDSAALITATGASIDKGDLTTDLDGIDTTALGAQTAYLVGTYKGLTTTVPITVTVQASGAPTLTVPTTTITVPEGAMPTQSQVLAATGATTDRGSLGVDFGTLTTADFARPGLTQTVQVTDTDAGASATPVPVTIQVTLRGTGTAADPALIGSVTDLDYAAAAINADVAHTGAAMEHYAVTADLDYGGSTFAGIAWFGGTLDGAGHTISDLVNPTSTATAPVTTMFTTLTGTVENLVLSHLTSNVTCVGSATNYDAALVNTLSGGTVRGVELVDSSVVMTPGACATNSFVGGLIRTTTGSATIGDDMVWNTTVGGNKYAAAIASSIGAGAVVTDNLVDATVYQVTSGSGAAVAGIVEQGAAPVTVTGNVLYGGSVTAGTGSTPASGGTHTVGAVGGSGGNFDDSTDLVSSNAAINPSGNGNATTPLNGTATSAADLALASTYEGVGWDFADGTTPWAWDPSDAHPVLRTAPLLQLTGVGEFGFAAGTESAAAARAAILVASSPTIDQGTTAATYDVDLTGVDFGTVGSYTAEVTATDAGVAATPRPVTVNILQPASLTVSVLNATLDLNAGATLTADAVRTRAGATASAAVTVDTADLAAVNAAAAAGSLGQYPVKLTTSVDGVTGPASTVNVNVVAPGAPVIEVTSTEQSHVAGDAITDNGGAAVLTAAGATATDGSTPAVDFPDGFDESTPGVYQVRLTDGAATPVLIELTVTPVPTPVITVTHPSISYAEGAGRDAATVLADLGASITDADAGATVGIDLAGVDFGTPGAYPVEVTGSFRGVDAAPVTATINVLLPGSGTAADPYLIGSASDLDAAAALVDQDTIHTGAAAADFRLTADIDYGGHTFADFTWYGGTFDGAGHTIRDITYATSSDAKPITAMFDTVTGTVEDLGLSHVTSAATCVGGATYYVAGLVDTLTGTLRGIALADSSVVMTKGACATNSFTGGLVRTASGTVTDSMVWDSVVTGNKYAGGLVSNGAGTITDNIVNATITQTTSGSGAGVGGVQASGMPAVATGNVIYGGSVSGTGTHTTSAIGQETTAGTPLGTDNLVSSTFLIVPGTNAATPDNGTAVTAAALATQSTYEGIGWSFGGSSAWSWVDAGAASHPILSYLPIDFATPVVAAVTPSITVSAQRPEPSTGDLLAHFGAATDHGTLSIDLGDAAGDSGAGVNFQLPGSYPVTIASTDGAETATIPATIVVTALTGTGTADDPLQIGSRADLDNAVDNMNNGDAATQAAYRTAHYALTADIDYAGDDFPGIDDFAGVFDGQGHTVSNLTYTKSTSGAADAADLAFFRFLDGATVENLSLNNVVGTGSGDVGGLADDVYAATIRDDSVIDATLTSSSGDVGGLVGGTAYSNTAGDAGHDASDGSSTAIGDNEVLGTVLTGHWVIGGVVAQAKGTVAITRDLADVAVTDTAVSGPGHGTSAGIILGAVGTSNTGGTTDNTVAVSDNVVHGGSVTYPSGGSRTGYAGYVIGDVLGDPADAAAYGEWSESGDLVSPTAVLADGLSAGPADTPGQGSQDGTASTSTALATQSTYEALGWDFTTPVWSWDDTDSRPTLAAVPEVVVPTVSVARTSVAYQVGSVPADSRILTDLGATVTSNGTAALDRDGADLTVAGSYHVTVTGSAGGAGSRAITVTVNVVPVITIATVVDEVEYVAGSTVTATQVLADLGASTSAQGSMDADLSGVDFGTVGTYPVTITATDGFGFDAPPVTATVQVVGQPATAPPAPTVSAGTVTITGTPQVGVTLGVDPGTWSPAAAPSYQWRRDGTAIAGATGATYTPVPADAGHLLQVAVTETPDGYPATTAVALAVTVAAGRFDAPTPQVLGTPKVGTPLHASLGTWAPAPEAVAYQWLRNGIPIAGASGATYTPTAADLGAGLSVQVDAVASGYTTAVVASDAITVERGTMIAPAPKVSGTAQVGKTLRAMAGTWSPRPTLTYQWLANGAAIRGATAASYTPTAGQAGKRIRVQVHGTAAGYTAVTKTSAAVTVRKGTFSHPAPRITGTARVGKVLTAVAGAWRPRPRLTYRWLLGGKPIKGATHATYRLPAAARGKRISVRISGTLNGYATATATSATRKVSK